MKLVLKCRLAFVVAMRYVRGYESYIPLYVQRVRELYPSSKIIIVDNNSLYPDEILHDISFDDDIYFLVNTSETKFEVGAYKLAIDFLELSIRDPIDYVVFSQDTFLPNKQLDFDLLKKNRVMAAPFGNYYQDGYRIDFVRRALKAVELNEIDKPAVFCWCCCFVLAKEKLSALRLYLEPQIAKTREDSSAAERYLGVMLYELNGKALYGLDGDIRNLKYDCWTVDPICDRPDAFFVKKLQQKTERTKDA